MDSSNRQNFQVYFNRYLDQYLGSKAISEEFNTTQKETLRKIAVNLFANHHNSQLSAMKMEATKVDKIPEHRINKFLDDVFHFSNLPDHSLPLTQANQNLVIAHNMTHIIRFKGHGLEDGCNSRNYPITQPIGGYTQVNVLADKYLENASLEQAVEHEMRAAKRCGIDGFQFYYTLNGGNDGWGEHNDRIIKAYFKVAKEKNIDFKLTFCFSHPSGGTEREKVKEFADRVNNIIASVGRDDPHWLRTPDGRLIVYLWYGEQLADVPPGRERSELPSYFYAAKAYSDLADAVGEKFACIYAINKQEDPSQISNILDYFPNVWLWTDAYKTQGFDETVADVCAKKCRSYAASVFNDFYTSKLLKKNTWDIVSKNNANLTTVERKYLTTGLSETFRNQLELAIKRDSSLINVITWNDFPEGHHMAPEVNHNYGFSVLLNYYKSILKGEPSPYADRDVAITFFKKYDEKIQPNPFNITAVNLGATAAVNDNEIEVVTILPEDGELIVNNTSIYVKKGLQVNRVPSQPGAVNVAIRRNGEITKSFKTPEWITDSPQRTDRLTYSFSTEFQNFHMDIFGDLPPIYSTEYNRDFKDQRILDLNFQQREIKTIDLRDLGLQSLDRLVGQSHLECLNLSGNKNLEDISVLRNFSKLKFLDLSHTNVTNLEPLKNLENIEELHLSHIQNLVWLGQLKKLKNLKILRLTQSGINDQNSCLHELTELQHLQRLDLSETNLTPQYIKNLRRIFPNCEIIAENENTSLDWRDQHLTSLHKLNGRNNLESVNLAGNKMLEDISMLANFKNLKFLDLSHTNVTNLSPLKNLENLEELHLSHIPNLVWVGQLKNLNNLKVLRLTQSGMNEQRSCLHELKDLKQLQRLDISQTNLSADYVNYLRKILPHCEIIS
jgi:Leucine-rich repeat (LRR) protein